MEEWSFVSLPHRSFASHWQLNPLHSVSNLQLADSTDGSAAVEVDLLIGSDYYWELATGRVSRGEDGPVAVETKLGWVLSGPALKPSLHAVFLLHIRIC